MPTLCLVEESQLRTEIVAWRQRDKLIKSEIETKAMPLLRYCNTGKRADFPICRRCSENYNKTCAENWKIRGLKFDTL